MKFAGFLRRIFLLALCIVACVHAQAVPYARSYAFPRARVEQALKDLQAYSGQKLPVLDGFVAPDGKPLDRYERGFYQFSVELLPGDSGGTIVSLSAKVTAWYADRDVAKSGYQVLPSNGRLELDFLDRLEEHLTGKRVASPNTNSNSPQAPQPKLDLSGARAAAIMASPLARGAEPPDEVAALRNQRIASEKRVQQLNAELASLQEIQRSQAHPQNLLIIKKSGTPVYARNSESSRILFQAAANDEFEFLDVQGEWLHVSISGDSRGYLLRNSVEIPAMLATRIQNFAPSPEEKFPGFRIARDETSPFPGDWPRLKGKSVRIYTVQLLSQNPKETGPAARLSYSLALFEKGLKDSASLSPAPEGVVIIFDAADGGIVAATLSDIDKLVSGSLKREAFWQQSYLDPPDAFSPLSK